MPDSTSSLPSLSSPLAGDSVPESSTGLPPSSISFPDEAKYSGILPYQIPQHNTFSQDKYDCQEDYEYDYLSEPNENLLCPICRNPFLNPVMCESTDHIFCQLCLIKSLEVSSACPIDRLPLSISLITPAPKIINKLVDELLVSCPFKSKLGCSFVCQRDLMCTHARSHQSLPSKRQNEKPGLLIRSPVQPLLLGQQVPSQLHQGGVPGLTGEGTSAEQAKDLIGLSGFDEMASDKAILNKFQTAATTANLTATSNRLLNGPSTQHMLDKAGCSVADSPKNTQQHLPCSPEHSVSPNDSGSQISSEVDIFQRSRQLEERNKELKIQLSQSLLKQNELVSALESLKASFRQLWVLHQSGGHDLPISTPLEHARFASKSPLSSIALPTAASTNKQARCPNNFSVVPSDCSTSSTPSDERNSYLIEHSESQTLSCFASGQSHHSSFNSASSALKLKIKTSKFVSKGNIITPTSDIRAIDLLIHPPTQTSKE